MRLRPEAKVGLVVFGAIVLLIFIYFFLGGLFFGSARYNIYAIFPDARKIEKGADVRMAGVKIGIVSDIRLTSDSQARLDLAIARNNRIPIDSVATITAGGLIGDNYVDVLPGSSSKNLKPGSRIRSKQLMQFEQILQDTGELLDELKQSAANLNKILGDKETTASLKNTVLSLEKAAKASTELIASAQGIVSKSSPEIEQVFSNLNLATQRAVRISEEVENLIAVDARGSVKTLTAESRKILENLNEAICQAQKLMSSFESDTTKVGQILDKANEAAYQAKQMMQKLNEASGSIKELAMDSELKENIRSTVRNAAEASEHASKLMESLNRRFGKREPVKIEKTELPEAGITTNSLYNADKNEYRFDVNYTYFISNNDFLRIGAYNLGESTKLNLQFGLNNAPKNYLLRYGLYASRLGIGYDYKLDNKLMFSADLFRPNEPEMELRGIYRIAPSWGLYGGIRDLFHSENRDLLVGVRYNK